MRPHTARCIALALNFAVWALIIFAATAGAATVLVEPSHPAAQQAWPNSSCAGALTTRWESDMAEVDPRLAGADGGYLPEHPCVVFVRATLRNTERGCVVEVHEAGHAAGQVEHDAHPSIMDPAASAGWAACGSAPPQRVGPWTPRMVRLAVRAMIADMLPRPASWRVTCGKTRSPMRCHATRGRALRRYTARFAAATGDATVHEDYVGRRAQ